MKMLIAGLVMFLGVHSLRMLAPAWREQMKDRLDSGTFDPWMQRLSQTIQQVTSDQYMDLNFDGRKVTRSSAWGITAPPPVQWSKPAA